MEWIIATGDSSQSGTEALVLPIGDGATLSRVATRLNEQLIGGLATMLTTTGFTGKANTARAVYTFGHLPCRFLILVGTGPAGVPTAEQFRLQAAVAARAARDAGVTTLTWPMPPGMDAAEAAAALAEGTLLGLYKYTDYKSTTSDGKALKATHLYVADGTEAASRDGLTHGEHVAEGVAWARDLVSQPGADLWPDRLATLAATMASEHGLACRVYDEQALADLGAGALLAVGRGSDRPPRLIHLRYRPAGAPDAAPIAFVGKGITFDTGGYSMKTAAGMETMKCDMGGAAAVLGAMRAIARLQPAVAVDGIIATAENMVSGRAMRPGDVLRSMGGKTIEVNNTDAEGRLVLADALTFAIREGATELIDLATLTGACVVALGTVAVGVMGNHQPTVDRLLAAAAAQGERMWQLPLYEEYREGLRSEIADLRNSGGRNAGAQVGAIFLKEFVGDTPWVHLDIAGPAWLDKDTPLAAKGASGVGVRTLIHYAEEAARRAG